MERLGHKGDAFPVRLRELLRALFKDQVPIRHQQRLRVPEINLVLSAAPFALGIFDRQPGRDHAFANRAHERLILRRL